MQLDFFGIPERQPVSDPWQGSVETLHALADTGQRYGCIYADPPWPYANMATRGSIKPHYPSLPVEVLRALPVEKLALPKAHLHLWCTAAFLEEGMRLVRLWGFDYKGIFVWCKPMGTGNYWRNSAEFLLLGVRGTLRFQDRSLRNYLYCKRGQHSRKPDQVRQLIEKASPAPRLELFGREAVAGWTVWGNQITPTLFAQAGG